MSRAAEGFWMRMLVVMGVLIGGGLVAATGTFITALAFSALLTAIASIRWALDR
jgi:hypothetical protein